MFHDVTPEYMKAAEKFHATLSLGVDMPVEDIDLLCVTKLRVNVGYSKLHVDKSVRNFHAYKICFHNNSFI